MSVLKTNDLKKHYQTSTVVKAIDGIDFSVESGEFVSIVGSSGSGKSTLLHLLGGLDRPTSGSVEINGKAIYTMKDDELTIFRRRNIGFVFQSYNLVPVLNVEENILLPIELDGNKPDLAYVEQVIEVLGLTEKRLNMPNQLSGGQQQRVAIARAMAMKPEVLLFDEATSALDPEMTGEVIKVMRQLSEEGMTMMVVTHEMGFAKEAAHRVMYLHGGQVVEYDTPDVIFNDPKDPRTKQFLQNVLSV